MDSVLEHEMFVLRIRFEQAVQIAPRGGLGLIRAGFVKQLLSHGPATCDVPGSIPSSLLIHTTSC